MSLRKLATVLVGLGLVVGLVGAGVSAQFTDSATATSASASARSRSSIDAVAPAGGTAVVVGHATVTITCPTSSARLPASASRPSP